jgi:hypothetical protein
MHRLCPERILPLAALLLLSACAARPRTADDIHGLYRTYRDAVAKGDGAAAAECVSASTFDEYQTFIRHARTADESMLRQQSIHTRLQVLLLRQRLDEAALSLLDGRELFVRMIDERWIGGETVAAVQIGDIQVRGERADAPTFAAGQRTGDRTHFIRQDGRWKIDLVPGFRSADRRLAESAERERKSEDEFLLSLVETASGRPSRQDSRAPMQVPAEPMQVPAE